MVKYTQTSRRLLQTNYLRVLDHFVGLALGFLTNTFTKSQKICLIDFCVAFKRNRLTERKNKLVVKQLIKVKNKDTSTSKRILKLDVGLIYLSMTLSRYLPKTRNLNLYCIMFQNCQTYFKVAT